MFYSATLLTTSGPLARVWLSANQNRLTKVQILQTDLEDSISAIIAPEGDAPYALRFSAQLLVGVARIYGRKARYLLDDCNEALMKIKMVRCRPVPRPNGARGYFSCDLLLILTVPLRPSGPPPTMTFRPISRSSTTRSL